MALLKTTEASKVRAPVQIGTIPVGHVFRANNGSLNSYIGMRIVAPPGKWPDNSAYFVILGVLSKTGPAIGSTAFMNHDVLVTPMKGNLEVQEDV